MILFFLLKTILNSTFVVDNEVIRVYLLSSFYILRERFWGKALSLYLVFKMLQNNGLSHRFQILFIEK